MNAVFIPVRGGSKSIPLKNIKPICGRPLVYWTVKAACLCKYVDKVYIATDSDKIRETVELFKKLEADVFTKAEVIDRSAETASDTASTESAMLEFAKKYEFDNIALVQATSPLLCAEDLDGGFELFDTQGTDSVLSVVKQYRFLWKKDNNLVSPQNYDIFNRPRRQDFDGFLMENGAFYITSKELLLNTKNRISGNIKAYEMSGETAYEIDEPSDWLVIEQLMNSRNNKGIKIPDIKMFLTDCDGCLTDAGMYYSEKGDELKKFNTKDGVAFGLLRAKSIITGVITGENVELNKRRAQKLKLDILVADCHDKAAKIKELAQEYNVELQNVCYVGDDIIDVEALKMVGLSCCPSDACEEVLGIVDYVSNKCGGQGVIREIAETILKRK